MDKTHDAVDDRPTTDEYASFYQTYVSLVPEHDVLTVLSGQPAVLERMASALPVARETFRYAPGKWTVREVLGHMTDAERVFGYRAFCISRGEQNSLPGFDENHYAANADAGERELAELVNEFSAVRSVNLAVLRRLTDTTWRRIGSANGTPISVRALTFILAGHVRHHLGVLKAKYGVAV